MSGYSVFLHDLEAPEPWRLAPAFSAIRSLTPADAVPVARNAFGVLVESLDQQEATQLCDLLRADGVEVEAVATDTARLPDPFHLRRASTGPDGFVTFSVYGQPEVWAWETLMVIALGCVRVEETRSHKFDGKLPNELCDKGERKYWQEYVERTLLDLVFGYPLKRFRIDAAEFDARATADIPQTDGLAALLALINRICAHAPGASRNRGVHQLLDTGAADYCYSCRVHFEKETTWHLWHDWVWEQPR